MKFEKLKELATTLMNVQENRQIKNITPTKNKNILNGVWVDAQGKDNPLKIEYFPKHDSIRASTSTGFSSDYGMAVQKVEILEKFKSEKTTYKDLEKPIMSRAKLAKKFENNEIKIILHGHFRSNQTDFVKEMKTEIKERFLHAFNHNKDGANGKFDGTWTLDKKEKAAGDTIEKTNKEMREHYKNIITRGIRKYGKINDMGDAQKCSACGCKYDIVLLDENTVSIHPGFRMKEEGDLHMDCEFASGTPHSSGEIKVEGGKIIFANFFPSMGEDTPKDKKYSDEFDLCSHSGRRNITKWKAENQNVAYGQMGNMSLSVWVNDKKDRIILTEAYIESNDKKKKAKLKKMKMKQVGDNISLAVWRWEATDIKTVEKAEGKDIKSFVKDMEKDCKDVVVTSVKNGIWEFTHFYDTTPDPKEDELFIYAELKLKTTKP